MVAAFCAKSPVYENCRMLAADGQLLSFIDARKLAWYLVRPRCLPGQAATVASLAFPWHSLEGYTSHNQPLLSPRHTVMEVPSGKAGRARMLLSNHCLPTASSMENQQGYWRTLQ